MIRYTLRKQANLAIFVRRSDRPPPRVTRMMTVAGQLGFVPLFVGAHRESGSATRSHSDGFEVRRIGRPFRRLHGSHPILYLLSVLRFSGALVTFLWHTRPGLVHASDFEVYAAARLYTFVFRARLIYNIHDNLADRYAWPRIGRAVLNLMEGVAVRLSSVTVVPEASRKAALPRWSERSVRVVRNSPIDPGFHPPPPRGPHVTLLYAGWLDAGRGIREMARLVSENQAMRLRIAGSGDVNLVQDIAGMPGVSWLGRISHADALRETAACDFVGALYDPRIAINRHAASNKVAEALAIGRPLLINREVEITKLLAPYRCTVLVDYQDSDKAASVLSAIREARDEYEAMCRRSRQAYEDHFSWDKVRADTLDVFEVAGAGAKR